MYVAGKVFDNEKQLVRYQVVMQVYVEQTLTNLPYS